MRQRIHFALLIVVETHDQRQGGVFQLLHLGAARIDERDATFEALRKSLDTRRLMELVQNVAFYNMVVRILVPLGVEVEPGVTKL